MDPNGHTSASSSAPGKRTLEDLFRPPIDLMFKGNLQNVCSFCIFLYLLLLHSEYLFAIQARDAGVSIKKWLMVNVQNVSEFSCQVLNRDVWSNTSVKELIRDHFIFLQVLRTIISIPVCKRKFRKLGDSFNSYTWTVKKASAI